MLSCYTVHYLIFKDKPATFIVLAHSERHAVQLMWRYAKIVYPKDYLSRFFYDVRYPGCTVKEVTHLSPSYISGLEKGYPGF